ncbi:MAG: exo-alpha-sialidase [Prevotella sp.]|nr:exo-alpha-sialidase [Prevotella sp.]MBQ5455080.1 exo-alpha-sialidase [Prevotella sp.]
MKKALVLIVLFVIVSGCKKIENGVSKISYSIQSGQLFKKGEKLKMAHASSVLLLPNGKLMCVWYGKSKEGLVNKRTKIWYSFYHQGTWDTPMQMPTSDDMAHWNPVLQDFGSFARVYFKVGTNTQTWVTKYCDYNYSSGIWSGTRELVEGDYTGGRGPVKNKCLITSDGLIIAGASTEQGLWKSFFDLSADGGNTWKKTEYIVAKVSGGSYVEMIEPTLWQDQDGVIHALFRTKNKHIYRSDSYDGGYTWGEAYPTYLPNNNSSIDCVTTSNGWLWLAYNPIVDGRRNKLVLSVSMDNGNQWEDVVTLEESLNPISEFSYPSIIADGNDIIVTYTYKREVIKYALLSIGEEGY